MPKQSDAYKRKPEANVKNPRVSYCQIPQCGAYAERSCDDFKTIYVGFKSFQWVTFFSLLG